jgi:tight adherence protein B
MSALLLRRGDRGRAAQLLLVALLIAACWLVGPGIRWASAQTGDGSSGDGSSGDAAAETDRAADRKAFTDRQIQVLRTGRSGDKIEVDVAIPASIGDFAPTASDFGLVVDRRLVNNFEVALMSSAVDVVVVIDTSGSMNANGALDRAKSAARSFVNRLPEETAVGVIGFGETATVYADPGLDRSVTLAAFDALSAEGETALWSALDLAADTLGDRSVASSSSTGSAPGYVVLLSDGGNTVPSGSQAQSVDRLDEAGVGLYAIAIDTAESDHDALRQTVDAVGGNLALTADTAELDLLYAEIAERLSARYRITFPDPLGAADGNGREDQKVLVSVKVGDSVAMAQTVLAGSGAGAGGNEGAEANPGSDPDLGANGELSSAPAGPAQVLNADDTRLGAVAPVVPGMLGRAVMLPVGIGAMFLALLIAGFVLFAPSVSVSLTTANTADRVVGFNQRLAGAVDRVIDRRDSEGELDRALDVAGISLRPGEFTLVALAVIVVPSMLFWLVAGLVGAVVVALVAAAGVYLYVSSRADRRRQKFAAQLTDTLGIMTGSLRAGRGLPQAIELVAAEAPDPTADQFRRILFETRVGRDTTDAMMGVAKRMRSQDFEWVTKAVAINRELGGDLTEVLDNVADTIRDRQRIARMVRSLSAEGRASGWVLLSLPIVMFLFVLWRTPDNAALMFTTGLGRIMLLIGLAGMVVGYLWIRKLVDLKY